MTRPRKKDLSGSCLTKIQMRLGRAAGVLRRSIESYGRDKVAVEGRSDIVEVRKNLREALEILNEHFPPEKINATPTYPGEEFGE